MKKFSITKSFLDKTKTGRPKILSAEILDQRLAWVEEDRRSTAPKLKSMVQEKFGVDVHERTIRRFLQQKGFFGGVCARKPLLREVNTQKRLAFAIEHVDKPLDFWKSVLFTDEKKFELVTSKRRIYSWKQKGDGKANYAKTTHKFRYT
jgi:hypothetical protein